MNIAIIGASGFVGSYLLDALDPRQYSASVLVRPGSESKIEGAAKGASLRIVKGDLDSAAAIDDVLSDCDAVVYLVGILREFPSRGITFRNTQYDGVVRVADAAKRLGVDRFLLMSANGVQAASTAYQRSKLDAERYVQNLGLRLTVMRPSVIFGDPRGRMEFASQLYQEMVRPPIPAVVFHTGWKPSTGSIRMSPVHVRDVADAFVHALRNSATVGETYALGGPEVLSWGEMLSRIAAAAGKRKLQLPMPIAVMRFGAWLFDWLPFFPVTRDQLTMLQQGNVCDVKALQGLIGRPATSFATDSLDYIEALAG
jgi:NADH dehydrogenase